MAYQAGDPILDDEYNTFVNSSSSPFGWNHFAGTGDGVYGLGQSPIATVSAGETINASSWNALFTGMDNIANHTNDSITSTSVTAGDTIAIKAALESDLASLAAEVAAGSPNASIGDGLSAGGEDLSLVASAVYDTSHIVEASFTFDGGDEARWFFNAGGKLRVALTNNATNSTDKDTSVSGLLTALGNFDMGATSNSRTGTGETLGGDQALGYYDLTTSYQTLMTVTEDSGTYSGNIQLKIEGKTSSAHADGRNNNGEVVTLRCSVLLNDTTRDDYDVGNTDGENVEAEAAGPTDWAFSTIDPNTSAGLSTAYDNVVVAEVSNNIVNFD